MRSVRYGSTVIDYNIQVSEALSSHYISVEKHKGVTLKGKRVSNETADRLILKKARWIIKKLEEVKPGSLDDIVTGSRIPYLGKTYYVQVKESKSIKSPRIEFNHSKFIITTDSKRFVQKDILLTLHDFYLQKAIEKITPRVEKLSSKTGFEYKSLQFRKMKKRWGSCTASNRIIINPDAIKLPYSLIDYLIVHELVHTEVKDHSKRYWRVLGRFVRNWRGLDAKVSEIRF